MPKKRWPVNGAPARLGAPRGKGDKVSLLKRQCRDGGTPLLSSMWKAEANLQLVAAIEQSEPTYSPAPHVCHVDQARKDWNLRHVA